MSRIGRMPVTVPAGVDMKVEEGNVITIKGAKGVLTQKFHPSMLFEREDGAVNVMRPSEQKEHKSLHGLTRTLLNNMVVGVTEGFKKELEINGVGYRAQKQGNDLTLNVGYSHQVTMTPPQGISIEVPTPNKIIIIGCDKQAVGQFASEVRSKRPPEPYKGKGIKYAGEIIRRKEGKTGAKKK